MGTRNVVFVLVFALTLGTFFVASPASAEYSEEFYKCTWRVAQLELVDRSDCRKEYRTSICDSERCKRRVLKARKRCYNRAKDDSSEGRLSCRKRYGHTYNPHANQLPPPDLYIPETSPVWVPGVE